MRAVVCERTQAKIGPLLTLMVDVVFFHICFFFVCFSIFLLSATLDWKDPATGKTYKVIDQTKSDVVYFPHTDTGDNHGPSDHGLG
jgi:hypothetical protein